MEVLSCDLPKNHRIALASDIHLGNIALHERGLQQLLSRVAQEKDLYLCLLGDQLEGITVDDPRFNPDIHDGKVKPLIQMEMMSELLRPIKHKTLTVLFGNHCHTLWRFGDLTKKMCQDLGINYGAYSCKLFIHDKAKKNERLYGMYLTHGRWSVSSAADDPIRREANMKLTIKRKLAPLASDCAIMAFGHTHQLVVADPSKELYLYSAGKAIHSGYTHVQQNHHYIPENLRYYVNTGSFLKNVVVGACTYSEFAGYKPIELGYAIVNVEGGVIKSIEKNFLGVDE